MTQPPGTRGPTTGQTLPSAVTAKRFQRAWFAEVRAQAASGTPIALVNADAPQEVFRAMGIPYVVNQWWASIVAAKRRSADYLELLRAQGLPDYTDQYSSLSLASAFDTDEANAPWGGLPTPRIVLAEVTGDASRKIFDVWGQRPGVDFYALESSAANEVQPRWWERMPWDWEELIGKDRIDLLAGELQGLIRFLETTTGRVFSESRFREVMALVNEQEEWNRRTRDLIAASTPCPISVVDSIPAVMVPQWHRGTEWARDASITLHDEVAALVAEGAAVCPDERVRLMWIGRGLWMDMGFYRHFQATYGAVFVWSMYLAIAADGYLRYGEDPVRALAARFAAFSDQLYAPPWSAEWYVKEALSHRVDGVVHLVSDDPRGSYFTTRALRAAGVPVLELRADNVDSRAYDGATTQDIVSRWLEEEILHSPPA